MQQPATGGRRGLARLFAATTLAATTALGSLALPAPAQADEVATAQARVDRLQGLVVSTTRTLTDGTRRWEADQSRLKVVRLQLRNTQRHMREAAQTAAEGSARVSGLARRLYIGGGQQDLQMAFTRGPDDILDALQVQAALSRVAGSDSQIVLTAQTARLRLQNKERAGAQLEEEARDLAARSAKRLRELNTLAQRTADELESAQAGLQSALADRAARAARAANAARAARDKAASDRASRSRPSFSGGPACTGKPTGGQQNGNLDPGSLCPLWMAPGHRQRSDAAAAFNAMSKRYAATRGTPLCVTDSYRSYSEQVDLYRRKPGLAAVPGTSNHGWGIAVDLCGGVQEFGSAAHRWMQDNAPSFGWIHPSWARQGGSKPEPWHWEFNR